MKFLPLLLLGALLGTSQAATPPATTRTNPVIGGDWSDPALIRVGDDYYSCRSSFAWQPGIPIAHSRDLAHWEYIGNAFNTHPGLPVGDTRSGIWGVDMGYNPHTKQFLIYAPTRGHSVYVYNASTPGGPYESRLLGEELGIDPGFFADTDGKLYLILSKGIIHELSQDGLSILGEAARIDRSKYKFFEGPAIYKHGPWYYLLFSDGGTLPHEPSTISCLRARSLKGPWEADPNNPVMFSTDNGARFEGPAHGSLIQTPDGKWFIAYHAHETAFYSLGRQMLMQAIEWTDDGWWRPTTGKVPTDSFEGPSLPSMPGQLAQSDTFQESSLGRQWFFSCPPDFSGTTWRLSPTQAGLQLHTQPGDLSSPSALPGILQQRVIQKAFSFEATVHFTASDGREAAGLHLFHDSNMNLWLASTVRDGKPVFSVGKTNIGRRAELWSMPNTIGDTVHLRISVDGEERATFFVSKDGSTWQQLGESLYFGASAHHLRKGEKGDPDLGWVGTYKTKNPPRLPSGAPSGNVWTGATFGVFAVQDGSPKANTAIITNFVVTPKAP